MNNYQKYIHLSRYSRFRDDLGRRETWPETVSRYVEYFHNKFPGIYPADRVYDAILNMDVMPSMRALMTAGEALDRDNMAGYNCAYLPVDHPRAFDEALYTLTCGTGVGFSVEKEYTDQLPVVAESMHSSETTIVVSDSRIGWASSFRELLSLLYSGKIPKWDLSKVRPSGARLKTFGGRASGPEPLDNLFRFTVSLFKRATGRKLTTLECHDLVCKIADIVVVGGVRRSALISLSDLTDERMRGAKNGAWWEDDIQRSLANNSVAYTEKPDIGIFMKEWYTLYESKSGERGVFNRIAAKKQAQATGRRNYDEYKFGTNPCGEIILRPNGLCNLSEVVIRPSDDFAKLREKVEIATIIGTFQSTLTEFRYVRNVWKKNAEEERLLGVSLTGIMDYYKKFVTNKYTPEFMLDCLKTHAITTNQEWSSKLGINQSTAITCIKPSGTVSQLVDSSSGIHARYSPYYIRTVKTDKKDPLASFMIDQGIPHEDDVTKPDHTYVFSFPIKSPEGPVFRNDLTALEQLEIYMLFKKYWCEHNPSVTIYVKEHEWLEVGAWIYKNFDDIGGMCFLPHSDHIYKQAPYQEISKDEYNELASKMPKGIDWSKLQEYETSDNTVVSHELACSAGVCEF